MILRRPAPALLAAATLLAACATPPAPPPDAGLPRQPEIATGQQAARPASRHARFAVAAANPLATEAGRQMLARGGSALDAAIAVQMVLTLVEPQSSGIGGGAFLLHWDGQRVQAFDGRETAPAAADERLFLTPEGKPMAFMDAVVGGRSVGVPGTVRMLEMAHAQHGRLRWAALFEPAIRLAETGFPVSPRLHAMLQADAHLRKDPTAAAFFYQPDGTPWPVGHRLKNPELAEVLRRLARDGSRALHEGEIAQAIVAKVQGHPGNPGRMTLADLAGYHAKAREAICHDHTAGSRRWKICGFPPPSSGAIAVGQILGLMARTGAAQEPLATDTGLPSADWLHTYMEASRLAFADRAQYLGDPDFVPAPGGDWRSLLDPAYLDARARLIHAQRAPTAPAGVPGPVRTSFAPMAEQIEYGTSHISIVDAEGRAVSMTTTIEDAFGARQMVRGFLLNNELSDFSFAPADATGRPVANRVEPGKRPRSSMAPTLVFDAEGRLAASAGSPGGALIIHYTARTLHGLLQWRLDPQAAIDLPNFGTTGGPVVLEKGRFPAPVIEALKARGHEVREQDMTSGLQAIARGTQDGRTIWRGGADPRREGVVLGD
ncbi:gamma-glutamyltranspeptidase/glutathione hydrolase [Sphaerotilus sulfidivorans]|uniref:Gamma-glutamyltransferase family protein n=1 Tax=Sphaerotilus sulfidivorans TaxID=639200 RepID=A0A5C1PZY6_9BURK|nr:gamma-glutamyltransferase family protein [Sphaerotilus sulfidivorans]NZD44852.1 gamma-glutamyltransferase family protein [Sphaerotilus sulfidivorans]QEN00250.1 gamma-glutamyltransferase family protein [Sphaerotilus sulfidivorans]GIX52274.1 gamma-glutamyltranspeptidase [Sphaerotilus natans]